MKIVLDCFGGDNCPDAIVDGVALALKKYNDIEFILTGDETLINNYIKEKKYELKNVQIINAPDVITCNDVPTVAIRNRNESSLVVALDLLKKDETIDALISTGSTGAVLAGGFLKIGRIKGVSRPALCPALPTKLDKNVLLVDCGANADCKPINLCHFAIMGSIYYESLYGKKNPVVALLNNGTEDTKGNELVKQTFPLLKKLPINFVGNIEARDALSGEYDVIVCDGFTGNVFLKSVEGTAKLVMSELKSSLKSSFISKIGAMFAKKALKKVKNKLDYNKYGGSPFIGCSKTIIKSHGSSKGETILATIEQAYKYNNANINAKIQQALDGLQIIEEN